MTHVHGFIILADVSNHLLFYERYSSFKLEKRERVRERERKRERKREKEKEILCDTEKGGRGGLATAGFVRVYSNDTSIQTAI